MTTKTPTVVSVLNLKGGVGKTTVTALLARYAAHAGGYEMSWERTRWAGDGDIKKLDVLAVDLDPQSNLSQAMMGGKGYQQFMGNQEPSIVELFNGYCPASGTTPSPTPLKAEGVIKKITSNLEIIPSRFDFSYRLIDSIRRTDENVLATFIAQKMAHKDLILIDCAPTESILTRVAYHASAYVLIPVRTEFFSTIGFPLMKESLDDFHAKNRGHNIKVCGILINRNRTSGSPTGPHHNNAMEDIKKKANEYQWSILENFMPHSDGYPKWAQNADATHLGNAPKEWVKVAYEILNKIGFGVKEE